MGSSSTQAAGEVQKGYATITTASGQVFSTLNQAAKDTSESFATITTASGKTFSTIKSGAEESSKSIATITTASGKVLSIVKEGASASGTALQYATQSTQSLKEKGEETAESLKANIKDAGKAIGDAIGDGVDKAKEKLKTLADEMKARTEEINAQLKKNRDQWDAFQAGWSSQTFAFGDTQAELQTQLKQMIQERSNHMRQTRGNMGRGFEHAMWEQYSDIIGEIQGRIEALKGESSGSGFVGSERTHRTIGGRGMGDETLVLGSTGGGLDVPTGTSRTRRSSSPGGSPSGGGTVMIEGAQFNIIQNGIDPQAIDARGLVRAMLPALREEVRRGELAGVRSA